ncbi:MAG: PIN domain-containing protein [Thiotrichaceae bacterium]
MSCTKVFKFKIVYDALLIHPTRASYVEEFSLSHGVRAGDALIAATATEHKLILATANRKHFSPLQEQGLMLHIFKP